jgi:hypothetical protein
LPAAFDFHSRDNALAQFNGPVPFSPTKIGFLGGTGIDTTDIQTVKMSAQWSVASAGNSVRLDILAVEILSAANVG